MNGRDGREVEDHQVRRMPQAMTANPAVNTPSAKPLATDVATTTEVSRLKRGRRVIGMVILLVPLVMMWVS